MAATVDAATTSDHSPRIQPVDLPEALRPVVADIDSGMLDRNTAATIATPTPPPPSRLMPIAADSGMPSSSAPSTSAAPLGAAAAAVAAVAAPPAPLDTSVVPPAPRDAAPVPAADPPDARAAFAAGSGCRTPPWTGLFLRCPPRRSMSRSPTKNVNDPAASPSAAYVLPADRYASSVSSNATALMSTPAPNAMTSPITRSPTLT